MGSPSGKVPERAPERFLVSTEACGSGTPDLSSVLEVLGYVGIYRPKKAVGRCSRGPRDRGARPVLASSRIFYHELKVSRMIFFPKITLPKVSFRLDSV